jgi:hypothetical protein
MNVRPKILVVALAGSMMGCATALAQETVFRTPSNNIHCSLALAKTGAYVDCELRQTTNEPIEPKPADCDFDWGRRFYLGDNGLVMLTCHSDTQQTNDSDILQYGDSIKRHGITCTSEKSGLTCKARNGKGFFLSRAKQRLF